MNIRILHCRLSEEKKASCVTTAHVLHQGAWLLLFLDFFGKISALPYKLIFFLYFSQLILLFTSVSFCQYFSLVQVVFFISYFWAIMEFEVYEGQITKIYHGLCYLMHQVIKRYRSISLHVSKWTQCYISFWTLLISKDTLLVWLEVIFQKVLKVF